MSESLGIRFSTLKQINSVQKKLKYAGFYSEFSEEFQKLYITCPSNMLPDDAKKHIKEILESVANNNKEKVQFD